MGWSGVLEFEMGTQASMGGTRTHSGPFPGVTLHILEIKKIYQHIVNNANLSVLKLEKRYLHENGVEFCQKLNGNQFRGIKPQF